METAILKEENWTGSSQTQTENDQLDTDRKCQFFQKVSNSTKIFRFVSWSRVNKNSYCTELSKLILGCHTKSIIQCGNFGFELFLSINCSKNRLGYSGQRGREGDVGVGATTTEASVCRVSKPQPRAAPRARASQQPRRRQHHSRHLVSLPTASVVDLPLLLSDFYVN